MRERRAARQRHSMAFMASPFARAGAVARARISCCAGGWCRRIGAGSGVSSNPLRSGAVACARRARLVVRRKPMPIVPDESRTFGMEGLFRQIGIWNQQ
ncbi:hypothetical protein DEE73_37520, partial [Burkholderia contaminans]